MPSRIVFVISGPSGSGKTTLIERLIKREKNLVKIITCTTRRPRGREKHGRDYIFLGRQEFIDKIKKGEFLEWQEVLGEYYGTPLAQIETNARKGKDSVLCIDVKGARTLKDRRDFRFVRIFILPSGNDWQKTLERRLYVRASDPGHEIKKRLKLAREEIRSAKEYSYTVVNRNINKAAKELVSIVVLERKE